MRKYMIWTGITVLIAILVANMGWRRSNAKQPEAYSVRSSVGQPYIFQRDIEYPAEIGEIAVNNSYLYTLYEKLLVVEVFDLHGKYVCSIAVTDESGFMNPARCHVYAYDDAFFIECFDAVYEFHGTEFVQYHQDAAARSLIRQLNAKQTHFGATVSGRDGTMYCIRETSILAQRPDGSEKAVLQRPAWTICYSAAFSWLVTLICIGGALFLHTRLENI